MELSMMHQQIIKAFFYSVIMGTIIYTFIVSVLQSRLFLLISSYIAAIPIGIELGRTVGIIRIFLQEYGPYRLLFTTSAIAMFQSMIIGLAVGILLAFAIKKIIKDGSRLPKIDYDTPVSIMRESNSEFLKRCARMK